MASNSRPPWVDPEPDEPNTISDCFFVSFDIGENMDIPTAVVGKKSSTGFHVVNLFQEDDAIALYETLTGEEVVPN